MGQFVTPDDESIEYQQVFLECASTTTGVQRVLTLASKQYTAKPTSQAVTSETYYSNEFGAHAGQATGQEYEWNETEGGWNEEHCFRGCARRFIVRMSQIHCALDYASIGGSNNNANLGVYGRVWVRDSTQIPDETDLPTCVLTSVCQNTARAF